MKSNKHQASGSPLQGFLFSLFFCFVPACLCANNIQVSNVSLTGQNFAESYTHIRFDISWENSWRVNASPGNWDAAWVFVKYRKSGESDWHHAYLNHTGHIAPAEGAIDAGLIAPGASFDVSTNPAVGAFIYRSGQGIGDFTLEGVQLRWNYAANPNESLDDPDLVEVSVMAIEMVYVPEGSFFVGSGGNEAGRLFRADAPSQPFQITSENAITTASSGAGNLWGAGGTAANVAVAPSDGSIIPAAFPKGFAAFYCMKYNLTQGQYVAFLNKLTRDQQAVRVSMTTVNNFMSTNNAATAPLFRNGVRLWQDDGVPFPRVYINDLNANGTGGEDDDGETIACNHVSWADLAAYLDWSGLRPMTELEFEKACRGTRTPIPEEYPWGTATIKSDAPYTLSNPGTPNETIGIGYASVEGNALYALTKVAAPHEGPMRVGIMADHPDNRRRTTAGAGFYGILDLAGNMQERPVSIGNATGRIFSGTHGDGSLTAAGQADVLSWPSTNAVGIGFRGGSYNHGIDNLKTSERHAAANTLNGRFRTRGGRGVRTAP